jgi:1-acyl-sn-glycerol-3-phosphate acyltransferase
LVSDHSTLGDPLVLLATAGRPLQFLMAQEIYERWAIRWVFRAFQTIPVRRGSRDIRAIRTMMRILDRGEVVAVFPEGGIDSFRDESGHLGVAYLVVKTGAPIIPVSIRWAKKRPDSIWGTLFVPGQVSVRYGQPLRFPQKTDLQRVELEAITRHIMRCIKELSEAEYSLGGQGPG